MIYLTTGANGAGKTLFTLHDVRAQQLAENRPVYYHGFKAGQPLIDFGWKEFEPSKWQELPDGSICIFDEAQNEMPAKASGAALPEWINAIAQFRRARGFDFWIITPHPSMIHTNVRKLIESPSYHRHFKRVFGSQLVSELKFNYAETRCELPGSGKRAVVTMRPYPKESFKWYQSTTLDTSKRTIPKQIYVFFAALLLVPVLGYLAYSQIDKQFETESKTPQTQQFEQTKQSQQNAASQNDQVQTVAEYLESYAPRLPGLPHTAPRFDDLTKPAAVPYPAACVSMGSRCNCYTQQATPLDVPKELCLQVVNSGYFIEWQENEEEKNPQKTLAPITTQNKPHLITF